MSKNYTIEELIKKNETSRNENLKIENMILKAEISKLFDQNLFLSRALSDMAEVARKSICIDEDEIELLTETIEKQNIKRRAEREWIECVIKIGRLISPFYFYTLVVCKTINRLSLLDSAHYPIEIVI